MSFVRQQQGRLVMRYLIWQYQKRNLPLPAHSELEGQAQKIIEEARQIARKRGRNLMSIVKDLIADLKM